MPTVRELQRTVTSDGNKEYHSREFIVNVLPPSAALLAPELPQANSPHPDNPTALVDRREAKHFGDGSNSLVQITYSTDRSARFSQPPPKPEDVQYTLFETSYETAQVSIPFSVQETVLVPQQGESDVEATVWAVRELKVEEPRINVRVRCSVQVFTEADVLIIASQVNKLHQLPQFGDKYLYRFTGAQQYPRSEGRFDVVYNWVGDRGTAYQDSWETVSGADFPKINPKYTIQTGYNPPLIRGPHERMIALPSEDPQTIPPSYDSVPVYPQDLNGWASLPGLTL